ncbi:acyl-CoA dehydrogenase family protein [Streptomyces sp. V4I23]|uniref:acyl-CoA dehydrogenase family protein n=1 Tax=Streptomyces sp. V4I23 TaxID=3042282 RepID=UPI00358FD7EC
MSRPRGLLRLEIPEEYGGGEARDYRYNTVLAEELAKVNAALSSCLGIHTDIVAPYLVDLTTEWQKRRWLPGFCSGQIVTAIGMTEPGGGSDLAALRTTAVRDGDTWVLNGSKTFITNGYSADLVVVAARTSPEKKAHGITLFGVKTGMEGFTRGRKLDKVGQKPRSTSPMTWAWYPDVVEEQLRRVGLGPAGLDPHVARDRRRLDELVGARVDVAVQELGPGKIFVKRGCASVRW